MPRNDREGTPPVLVGWVALAALCGVALLGVVGLVLSGGDGDDDSTRAEAADPTPADDDEAPEARAPQTEAPEIGAPGIEAPASPRLQEPQSAARGAADRGTTTSETDSDLTIEREPADGPGQIGVLPRRDVWVNPGSSTLPWSATGGIDGLLTFRGNPTRSYHGRGPIPERPEILWETVIGCSNSSVGGEPKQWCGTGWTGQPAVFPAPGSAAADGGDTGVTQRADAGGPAEPTDRSWWVGIGGYNRSVNFFDPDSGEVAFPAFATGDIIKGSITVDPDGYPLVYSGSRDDYFHIIAIDGDGPIELWKLSAADDQPTLWNNDWDSSALVIDDHLFVGGENSRFYIVALNRGFDDRGRVTVDPEVVLSAAGWDDELLAAIGDRQVSIENSVAISGNTVYFTNSGGLVQGWDISQLQDGQVPERVFRYWTGDDTDASIVIDDEGMLYVASEYERGNQRSRELGQVFKLDPSNPDDPLVWSSSAETGLDTGVWATPALSGDLLIVATDDGRVLGLERDSGRVRWTLELPGPLWSSPVVVDGVLIQGDCEGGLNAFDLDVGGDARPRRLWRVELGGCIESTPAVWDGKIFVGSRSGRFYAVGDAN